eukprot:266448-Pyramimonas_sp.AAC.1
MHGKWTSERWRAKRSPYGTATWPERRVASPHSRAVTTHNELDHECPVDLDAVHQQGRSCGRPFGAVLGTPCMPLGPSWGHVGPS